ncbi:MAG: VCBS repeat-containing protein [Phycisphaerales bacterium]
MNRSVAWVAAFLTFALCLQSGADDGILNLGPEEFVQAGGADIVVPGYSVPSLADWNNDGLKDLIVGEGGGGATGKVRIYLNVGIESDPCFVDYFYAQAGGADLTCTPMGCQGCFPRVVYWDEDARKDLLVGLGDGTVSIFLNVADENEPAFDAGTLVMVGNSDSLTLDVGERATPSLVHWNDDGMLDLVVGGRDGLIHVFYNCGCGGAIPPHFSFSPPDGMYVQAGSRDLTVPNGRSSPEFVDLDADGKKDLLTGNTDGLILFYKNTGTASLPDFTSYTLVQSEGVAIDLPGTSRSRPFICTWTGDGKFGPKDGYWDLLVGYGDGKIRLYRGLPKAGDFDYDGDLDADDFTFLAKALDQPIPPEGTPADLNADGVVDSLDLRLFADLWLAASGRSE